MNFLFIILLSAAYGSSDFTFNKESGQAVPNYCAEVKIVRGGVFKDNSGQLTPVKEGTRFYKNDTIVTKDKSFAKILFSDDSAIQIGSNTEIRISEYQYSSKTDRRMILSLIKGQLRGLIKNKAKEGDLKITTKLATMGIRGTELLINHQELKDLSISSFGLLEGLVDLSNEKKEISKLNPFDRITIIQNSNSKDEASEKNILSDDEKKFLTNEEEFLELYKIEGTLKDSPLYPIINFNNPAGIENKDFNKSNRDETGTMRSSPNWQDNLKKLNQKLKENQKKR